MHDDRAQPRTVFTASADGTGRLLGRFLRRLLMAPSASNASAGIANDSSTVLPATLTSSDACQRLQLGLRARLHLGQRQESADDVAQVVRRLVVARLGADGAADAAVDVAADREPGDRRNLARHARGQMRLLLDRVEAADRPRVAAVEASARASSSRRCSSRWGRSSDRSRRAPGCALPTATSRGSMNDTANVSSPAAGRSGRVSDPIIAAVDDRPSCSIDLNQAHALVRLGGRAVLRISASIRGTSNVPRASTIPPGPAGVARLRRTRPRARCRFRC